MNILVIGGTRFFGIPMVNELLAHGHNVTIATRGTTPDSYGDSVKHIIIQRTQEKSMKSRKPGLLVFYIAGLDIRIAGLLY